MPLSADQRAMLQLLLERDQSYEDIASLLDVDLDEVRSRARGALVELGGEDPDEDVGLTDFLLGQADPIGRADAVRHLQSDPDALSLASDLEAKLRMIAPEANLPQLPGQRGRRRGLRRGGDSAEAPAPGDGPAEARRRGSLSRRQQQVIVAMFAAAVLLIAGVLAVTGFFTGNNASTAEQTTTSTTSSASSGSDKILAAVPLKGQGGSDATGKAIFGIAGGNQPYLEASVQNLQQPPQGRTYVLWLLLSPTQGYPLSPLQIPQSGSFDDRFPIPQFAVQIWARARFVDVSLTQNASLQQQLPKAVKQGNPLLTYSGPSIARGTVPASKKTAQGGASGGSAGSSGGSGG